jgi:hypothetical protein
VQNVYLLEREKNLKNLGQIRQLAAELEKKTRDHMKAVKENEELKKLRE